MRFLLARWRGTGTTDGDVDDPFRPDVDSDARLSIIDLRPDVTIPDGWGLVAVHGDDWAGGVDIGDDPWSRWSGRLRRDVEAHIGRECLSVADLAELLVLPKVQPRRSGLRHVRLGGLDLAAVQGEPRPASVSHPESWPNTGNLVSVGADLTWGRSIAGSMPASWVVVDVGVLERTDSPLEGIAAAQQADTDDNQCDGVAVQVDRASGTFAQAFFGARCGTANNGLTGYFVRIDHSGSDHRLLLRRYVNGSSTDLGSTVDIDPWDPPHDVRILVDGSTIEGYVDDVMLDDTTDTAIETGRNTQLASVRHASASNVQFGPLTFADVDAEPSGPPWSLTVNVEGQGTVDVEDDGTPVDPDTYDWDDEAPADLTAAPDSGWEVDDPLWTGDGIDGSNENDNPLTLVMDQDRTVTANFVEEPPPDIGVPDNVQVTHVSTAAGTVTWQVTHDEVADVDHYQLEARAGAAGGAGSPDNLSIGSPSVDGGSVSWEVTHDEVDGADSYHLEARARAGVNE